jgi:hypothetical protein
MAMSGILCTLSEKRLAQLQEDPDTLADLLDARQEMEIPGLLDLGKTWDALDWVLSRRNEDPVLGDAILGRSGKKSEAEGPYGSARILTAQRVAEVSRALAKLPKDIVRTRYPELHGKQVHANYGQESATLDDPKYIRDKVDETREREIRQLETALNHLVALYAGAAKAGHSMLSVIA